MEGTAAKGILTVRGRSNSDCGESVIVMDLDATASSIHIKGEAVLVVSQPRSSRHLQPLQLSLFVILSMRAYGWNSHRVGGDNCRTSGSCSNQLAKVEAGR